MVLEERAQPVKARFELAARRIVEAWVAAGRIKVSAGDMKIAGEFLELAGFSVEHAVGTLVRPSCWRCVDWPNAADTGSSRGGGAAAYACDSMWACAIPISPSATISPPAMRASVVWPLCQRKYSCWTMTAILKSPNT